ncbi:Gfo/Idh/MocA family oxidoreductase [Paenibacillus sp. FSL K6-1217]|uniref:Gfo/Idh/MocA family protein n=1 Tax=Paenibacillus sp. FSL K6-1217 TaxID=2921466 RepID=UPI00325208B8
MGIIRFGLVGGGWRAEFYLRIAKALPERFAIAAMYVRNKDKAEELKRIWGVEVYTSLDLFVAAGGYSFAVICLKREAGKDYILRLAAEGIPLLAETPPAPDLEQLLQLWNKLDRSAVVQIAEQYMYQPMHAARIRLVRSGRLGRISQAQVSVAHGYHGISLIRKLLDVRFEKAAIRAQSFGSAIMKGPQRSGPPLAEELIQTGQTLATLDFGDRLGVYDFTRDQYFSWIRACRLLVRGERGEIMNDEISWLQSYDTPVYTKLRRIDAGHGGNLEGLHLRGIMGEGEWLYRNPFIPARLTDEEIAIAECLVRMQQHVEGGPSFYSLAEGCQDQYLALLMEQAAASGETVLSVAQPWAAE